MAVATTPPQALEEEYLSIARFAEEYNKITYLQLDSYTTQKVNLFALPEQERFRAMEFLLDKIIAALPSLKRIFSKPITRLKDVTNVLPVEAVRVINNQTMVHISLHTEHWGNVTKDGLKPRKLMTLAHEEDYKIYENIVFTRLVDRILSFVKKSVRLLKDIMYSCQPMRFNLLERTNHLMYFLAIGKLHVGYAHAQDKYHHAHQRCLEKLLFIEKTLRPKLNATVYKACKKDHSALSLKKTNVFRLQKDYKQVYNLVKLFGETDQALSAKLSEETLPEDAYADYCTLLSLFALGHFNFDFDEKLKFNFPKLDAKCTFRGWQVRVERFSLDEIGGLRFTVAKEKSYSVCLIFYQNEKPSSTKLRTFQESYPANEYLFAEPALYGAKNTVYLNLFDIDSFRRIQQFVLRGMVYADEKRDVCPFCGAPLVKGEKGHECEMCKTVITKRVCAETEKEYFVTELKDYRPPIKRFTEDTEKAVFFSDKEAEAALFFRNITPLSAMRKPRCPHCGKLHKN